MSATNCLTCIKVLDLIPNSFFFLFWFKYIHCLCSRSLLISETKQGRVQLVLKWEKQNNYIYIYFLLPNFYFEIFLRTHTFSSLIITMLPCFSSHSFERG